MQPLIFRSYHLIQALLTIGLGVPGLGAAILIVVGIDLRNNLLLGGHATFVHSPGMGGINKLWKYLGEDYTGD